ncbi:isochorismatase [Streptococcus penaeicida]|uniref:Isochorismatase n=1 Tax=Streptococcus penaeicida TaxID=1765960 RepID=A0A2N8LAU3_9STRE|nr:isochorismatase family protein [Streptococcus penaeicida]PND47270.1 isochorismatase [Streptococcus penaeicida]
MSHNHFLAKTALLLIDLQLGILEMPTLPYPSEEITQNAKLLIDRFRQEDAFIAFIRVKFQDGKDKLHPSNAMVQLPGDDMNSRFSQFPESFQVTESDYIVDKRGFSGFFGTDLDLQLRRRGIENLVICGISTHAAVDSTARDGYQYAYNQYFITDAMGATTEELHYFPIKNLFPLMGQALTTKDFLQLIEK